MISIARVGAVILIGLLSITVLKKWALVILGIVLLYYLIRFIADFYWYGKDNGKW